jgi:hypothetical protein
VLKAPGKCLFCLSTAGPFTREEHPIPEALGNDETILPPGFVCDGCNQYLGSKLEEPAVALAPFINVRVARSVRGKRRKLPRLVVPKEYSVFPTTYRDVVVLTGTQRVLEQAMRGCVPIPDPPDYDWLLCRLLVKMGLGIAAMQPAVDVYGSGFSPAREFVRRPNLRDTWQYAAGVYPRPEDLCEGTFERDGEEWVRDRLYMFSMGMMESGVLGFGFLYSQFYFAVNLNDRSCRNCVEQFNAINEFKLKVRTARHPRAGV